MKPLKQTGVQLKEANRQQIRDFVIHKERNNSIHGMKLQALYKLIQAKGVEIEESTVNERFNGVKALLIGDGFYIAMKRIGAKDRFYPCVLKSIYLQEL